MISILILVAIIYFILKPLISKKMETNDNNKNESEKESWLERNLWIIAVGLAIFLLRMCHELSR